MARCRTLSTLVPVLFLAACPCGTIRGQTPPDPAGGITADAVRRTKQATVMLKVTSEGGRSAEGSGFFAGGPGLVVTNAHVLGMLQSNSKPPTKIEVVVSSGTAEEQKRPGRVLGVDRANDVAVLRLEGTADAKLPAPLPFGKADDLVETQKVYVFGFPFGSELGKNITVSESSVSSLRTDARGDLAQVQVNGGMHPGNSGGPVVDARGRVIGVSVAGIRNTQINFAVPVRKVQALFDGSVQDADAGVPFRDKSDVRVPLRYDCLDPLRRVREVRVEVWAGRPAANRPFSPKEARPVPGDGPRRTQTLGYVDDTATGDVLLPKLAPGQVAWVQPVLALAGGETVLGEPQAFDAGLAVERVAADMNVKLAEQKERTVRLTATQSATLTTAKSKFAVIQTAEVTVLESFSPNPKGALVTVGFGTPKLTIEEDGKASRPPPEVVSLLQRVPPRFVVGEANKLRERVDTDPSPNTPPAVREQVRDYLRQICNGYEAATFAVPNRTVRPRETWPVQLPMMLKTGTKTEVVDLVMTCTLEGVCTTAAGSPEALVTFDGKVRSRSAAEKRDGRVAGRFTFDLNRGFISSAKTTISSETASPGGEVQAAFALDVDLTRVEGNPDKIALPKAAATPAAVVKREPPATPTPGKDFVPSGEAVTAKLFKAPAAGKEPASYMKVVSEAGDFIGQGKSFDYPGDKLNVRVTQRGVSVQVDGWNLNVGGPAKQFLKEGEYTDAKRFAFSGESPGLDFSGKGRGSNTLTGAFVVWELEIKGNKVVKLALDFVQHAEGKPAALNGKVRINSTLE